MYLVWPNRYAFQTDESNKCLTKNVSYLKSETLERQFGQIQLLDFFLRNEKANESIQTTKNCLTSTALKQWAFK